ncbi:MAG: xanthine dehydrogenase family protein molybdopterin-binding subunit [Deltaproteobacteria bacterium]|nr:xanthine dehydrogenase family protein molybdopterin-binding subunit [Deltaproteobacteria bacterium]
MSGLGENFPRVDGPAKLCGWAQFTADVEMPGMVYAKVLRSTYAHARLARVDASKAEKLRGVVAVLTRDDLKGMNSHFGPVVKDQPVVAMDRVRFVGDIVAAVAAEEKDIAEEALELIEVEYEPLPAVFDLNEAMKTDAPVIHAERVKAQSFPVKSGFRLEGNGNVLSIYHVDEGDIQAGFRAADEIFEDTYVSQKIQHAHLEPHAALAYWEPSGKLVVYTATQNPSLVRAQLADLFSLPQSKVRLIVPYVGGGYGAKTHPRLEPLAATLARKAHRPVQWILTREEVFLTAHCQAAIVRIKSGVKKDGRIVARQVEAAYDIGAYALTSTNTGRNGGEVSGGPYRIEHQDLTTYCVYTNTPPTGPYRGFGVPQVCWAYESQMDDIARRLGIDPLELRLKNLVHEGDPFVTGDKLISVGISDCLKGAAQAIGWQANQEQRGRELTGKVRGKGLAVMIKTTMTPSNSSALVRLNADGSAVLLTSSVEIGQGTQTSLAQIVAEELGISPERVSVTFPDTDVTPFDQSTSSSRTIFTMGSAARQAAGQIRKQLLEIGAQALEASVEDLELIDGYLQVRGAPEKRRTIAQLFQAHYGAAVGSLAGSYDNQTRGGVDPKTGKGKASAFFFLSACAAEVEVDSETGKVTIEKIVSAVDAGKAVNPKQCDMQNEGSMIMSLGSALFEEMVFDNGQPINSTFLEYMPPSMEDHPREFQSVIIETAHPEGPYGAKGVGEAALGPVEPAIGNAVANALNGRRIRELPLRPDRVLKAVGEREK